MYTTELASKQRKKFWTIFGQYMKPVPGAGGEAVNWLNYKTGVRSVFFRMDADKQNARVGIEIQHALEADRIHYYNHFIALKKLLEQTTGTKWQWHAAIVDENGQTISRISQSLNNVTVLAESDWPSIIAFLKEHITALDAFWDTVKDGFE